MLLPLAVLAAPGPERVRFDSLDRDGDAAVTLTGLLFRPEAPVPDGGRPAVIALHGCGGMFSAARGRSDYLSERHAMHAQRFVDAGYVVLFPDSFGPRGRREVCTVRMNERTITSFQRRLDAIGALVWLRLQPGIDPRRIALLGWSHGGSATLASVNAGDPHVADLVAGSAPYFRTAIAFYPGCSASLRNAKWSPAVPLTILIGGDDDWTPASSCEVLHARGKAVKWPLDVVVYPGAHHGFDAPSGKVRVRTDVPNGVRPGAGVHVGPEPKAREDALAKVDAILRAAFSR